MMLGERTHHLNPTVQVPPWDDPTATMYLSSPRSSTDLSPYYSSLRRFLPSNVSDDETDFPYSLPAVDAFSCDEFRMYEFKVRRCARSRSHDWTECPFAHPGEKARRRDPRKYHYSGTACPEFRKGSCKRGDGCEFAHGVFECWLHPARYRTQPCKDGVNCRRRVCFFAHTPEQLRVLPSAGRGVDSYDGSPMRQPQGLHEGFLLSSSPTSTLVSPPVTPPSESPPVTPPEVSRGTSVNELLVSLRQLQLSKAKIGLRGVGSPRGVVGFRSGGGGFGSVPVTPSRMGVVGSGGGLFDGCEFPAAERVESGRDLRAMLAEKLSKENSFDEAAAAAGPDVDWVSELVM